jgi:hypothetical protein
LPPPTAQICGLPQSAGEVVFMDDLQVRRKKGARN